MRAARSRLAALRVRLRAASTVDAGGVLQGAGAVGVSGLVVDQGSIVASGGTLVLGPVSGGGTLLTGVGADLVLQGTVGAGLTADFAGAGTLDLTGAQGAPSIEDFGTGDSILLGVNGAASAAYAVTAPGMGLLSIFDTTGQVLTQLTLLGSQAGRVFSVAGIAGGGTILTTQPDGSGPGGTTMTYPILTSGQIQRGDLLNDVAIGFPYVSQDDIGEVIGNQGIYLDFSTDGLPAAPEFGGAGQPAGTNVEVVAPLSGQGGSGVGPGSLITMQPGYQAVMLEGTENLALSDWDGVPADGPVGYALLAGNYGNDTIVAAGDGDTLVGATGGRTLFYAHLQNANSHTSLPVDVHIHGGGNDTILTTQDNADVTTSGGSSLLYLGTGQNDVVSDGSDTIVCSSLGGSDTIYAQTTAGNVGDLVFASGQGLLNFIGGNAPSTIVGQGMEISMQGGRGRRPGVRRRQQPQLSGRRRIGDHRRRRRPDSRPAFRAAAGRSPCSAARASASTLAPRDRSSSWVLVPALSPQAPEQRFMRWAQATSTFLRATARSSMPAARRATTCSRPPRDIR